MGNQDESRRLETLLGDWRWRLNNLYHIMDKDGRKVQFQMNWAQEALYDEMHYLNVILKARQLGFTTFIQIFMLDACVFNRNIRAGTIAHTLQDAQAIFRDKVKFPYDNLPDQLKGVVPIIKDNATELMLGNNSSIRVGTSLRSGTLQYLHVSEYGKLCAKYPEKAREVRTGALNTIQAGQVAFIESTAEGQEGHFYDICENAQSADRMGTRLTELDFKFHFYPWWKSNDYEIDPEGVTVTDAFKAYFKKLETFGISLTDRKKAWYIKKSDTQGSDMKREYPSTPQEAFEASVEGAYYADQMAKAEADGRIGVFPHDPAYPVDTAWDIGYDDANSIWFYQILPGRIRFIGYYENSGEAMPHYLKELARRRKEFGWEYRTHHVPHDIRVHEWTNGLTRIEQFAQKTKADDLGKPVKVPNHFVEDGINATRHLIGISEYDEAGCSQGLKCLKNYRKEWDEERGVWKDNPRHDWASHGADAKRSAAMTYRDLKPEPVNPRGKLLMVGAGNEVSLDDLWNARPRTKERI